MFSAENLVRLRKEKRFSQEEVARRSGLATGTISKLEEGKSNDPRLSTVTKLARALGCPLQAFLHEECEIERDGEEL